MIKHKKMTLVKTVVRIIVIMNLYREWVTQTELVPFYVLCICVLMK